MNLPKLSAARSLFAARCLAAVLLLTTAACESAARGLPSDAPTKAGSVAPPSASSAGAPPRTTPAPAPPTCGDPGQPPCPLQSWMRATVQAYLASGRAEDNLRMRVALQKLADAAPPEFPQWAAISARGAEAAREADRAGMEKSCGACHEAYRAAFRAEMRTRRIF